MPVKQIDYFTSDGSIQYIVTIPKDLIQAREYWQKRLNVCIQALSDISTEDLEAGIIERLIRAACGVRLALKGAIGKETAEIALEELEQALSKFKGVE